MDRLDIAPEETERRREIYEGYLALRFNPCWQWLLTELAVRGEYLAQRLSSAADWPEFCDLRGRLHVMESLQAQIAAIADYGKEWEHDI